MPLVVIVGNLVAAALVVAILTASGARVRGWLRFPVPPLARWAVDLVLGGGLLGIWVLPVGLAGGLNRWWLLSGLLIQAIIGRWKRPHKPPAILLTALVAGLPNLLVAAGPPHFFDAMVYHLGMPWQALTDGGWTAHPENLFASFPPLSRLIAAPALSVDLLRVPGLLHWWAWLSAVVAAAGLARTLGAGKLNVHLLVAACSLLPMTPLVPGFPAAEGWFLATLIPALACVVRPILKKAQLSGTLLLLGLGCAFRTQGVPWLVIASAIWLVRSRELIPIARAGGWAVLGASPWWLKNWILLGNPILPIGDAREGIETLWRDGGSLAMAGATPLQMLERLFSSLATMMPALGPVCAAAVLAAALRPALRPTIFAAISGMFAWAATGILLRFFAPTAFLLLIAGSALSKRTSLKWATAAALCWSLLAGIGAQARYSLMIQPWSILPLDHIEASALIAPNPPFQLYAELNRSLEADSRILIVGDPRGFGLRAPFIATSQHDVSPIRKMVEANADPHVLCETIRKQGFTHLIVNQRELNRLRNRFPIEPWRTTRGEAHWVRLLTTIGPPIASIEGVTAYSLNPQQPEKQ